MLVCRRLLIAAAIAVSFGNSILSASLTNKNSGQIGHAALFTEIGDTSSFSSASFGTLKSSTAASVAKSFTLVTKACKLSEFQCGTGHCIAHDKFCDGDNDCEDKSDEPKYCTPCNRTFYGDVGRTYEIEIRRPREDRLPFLCHLNFTAAGGELGDLVQLTFDTFTVGRFLSFITDGCPDGFMTIQEEGRPATGGQWCGSAWGYTVYYSETRSINLTLFLLRLSEQGIGYNFDFKMSYKFLKRNEAHLRYGNSSVSTWRGELVNGTYCDRILTRCDTRACRLQSPNYPGVYPRNVSCYYRIEQKRVPPGHRALLAVSQRNSHKIHIKDQILKYDPSQRILRVWDECNIVQDYLTVYDGGSTSDKVLVRLCGGDAVPDIVSSRDTMLLEFHTSPYDNPFHPVPLSFLPGFELEVQVLFVDEKSPTFVKENDNCDFYISSYDSPSGSLENPKHSLPPNTTCRYHFQGKPNEIVWISFIKYYVATADSAPSTDSANDCNAKLLIWDGDYYVNKISGSKNVSLMGQYCKDEVPRLCDHSLLRNSSRRTRPCSLAESYVSTGRDLTLENILCQGSALYPVSFVLKYEFVHGMSSCNHLFTSVPSAASAATPSSVSKTGQFSSPRNVFFFGRGGAQNLTCNYRFEAEPEQRVEISIVRASFGDKSCTSFMDPLVNRWACSSGLFLQNAGYAEIRVFEHPWSGVVIPRDCLCSNVSSKIVLQSLTSNVVEMMFTVTKMNVTQDYQDYFFEAEYRFVDNEPGTCSTKLEERRLRGTSGEISLRSRLPHVLSGVAAIEEVLANTDDLTATQCVNEPWLIEPEDTRTDFLYLRTAGFRLTHENVDECATMNRIIIYSAASINERSVICPESRSGSTEMVDFFSGGWNYTSNSTSNQAYVVTEHARSFVVEFLQKEGGFYAVIWMAISKRPASYSFDDKNLTPLTHSDDCPYRCPEIEACISPVLWCDGIRHCPSGYDEEENNCSYRFGATLLYVAIGAGALGIFLILLLATGCLKYCLYRHKARKKKKNVALNVNHLHVNQTHHNNGLASARFSGRYNITTPQEMYMENYGKDSIC